MRWMARFRGTGLVALLLCGASVASARDTVSCEGKWSWQRDVVRAAVRGWFTNQPRTEDLLELIQAEQGIVACSSSPARSVRLHTTTLPRGLDPGQLGAVLLANELEWSGLVPRPESGLAEEWFPVRTSPDRAAPAE